MRLRGLLGPAKRFAQQVLLVVRFYRDGEARISQQLRVHRSMHLPRLSPPRTPRKRDQLWAVSVCRDELDILPSVIDHLFDQGVDNILIADNRSKDGTREYLEERSKADPRLHLAIDTEPAHLQSAKMTVLAHAAWRSGAQWIIPFDADEFWYAKGSSLKTHLATETKSIVYADFHHMVPTTEAPSDPRAAEYYINTMSSFPGKVAFRSHPLAIVGPGNHYVERVGHRGPGLYIAHAQYRSRKQIARKVRQGTDSSKLTGEDLSWFAPHWEKGSLLSDSEVTEVWKNISQGKPDHRIGFEPDGSPTKAHPLTWKTWQLDQAQ